MEIVSTTDSPEQVNAALEANGYEVVPQTPAPAEATPAAPTDDNAVPSADGQIDSAPETEQSPELTAAGKPKPKRAWFLERIDELSRDKKELRLDNERLRSEKGTPAVPAAEETPAPAAPATPTKPERPKRPKQSEFDTIEALETAEDVYDVAIAKYEDDLAEFTKAAAVADFQATQQREQAAARVEAVHKSGREKYPDYEAAVLKNDDVKISGALLDAIGEYENPEDFLHYIGTHPEKAAEYMAETFTPGTKTYSPKEARAAARILATLAHEELSAPAAPATAPAAAAAAPAVVPVPPRRTSSAPAPIKPLGAGSSSPAVPDARSRTIGLNGWTAADERRASAPARRR